MGRPHKYRNISSIRPKSSNYRPEGIKNAEKIFLTAEEFEALRLRNYDHKKQTDAAEEMAISQTTYSRIVSRAYEKLAKAFIEGYAISIQSHPLDNVPSSTKSKKNQENTIKKNSKLVPELTDVDSKTKFSGFGCQDCGFEWASIITDVGKKTKPKGSKVVCPECQGKKTYRLIKYLHPN
ncbi:hypothetical protein NEF87_001799 [Candidatus Lokiarchaeum ossiferum]|uniref:Uncharacterized protein n=1 Tax=Candidatus Lokiarchaeum ossiferum TaxID=2951803 RepID=A0ABY6HSG9_9ARCH|nr:hypothetical protein NEF87_001799 [Candidatus Lokiarchaeum sp. B-35]